MTEIYEPGLKSVFPLDIGRLEYIWNLVIGYFYRKAG